jgi:predicted Zn-ribbon and HTH transcriptional regulator
MTGPEERVLFMGKAGQEREKRDLPAAGETIRQAIMFALEEGLLSANELSGLVGIPEKDVSSHLEHIRTSLHGRGKCFVVQPAECVKCGFVFEKRGRLTNPGRCPVCRNEQIHAPLFSIVRERT